MPYDKEDHKLGKKWDRERKGEPKPDPQPAKHKRTK